MECNIKMRLLLFEHLDEEPIGEERISYDMNMNAIAMQNASRSLDWTDNGRTIRCIANHIALDRPIEQTKPLEVYCKLSSL